MNMSQLAKPSIVGPNRHYGYSLRALKKHPALIPLFAALGLAFFGTVAQAVLGFTKLDVHLNKRQKLPPYERIDLQNPKTQKYMTFNQKYTADPRLVELKKQF